MKKTRKINASENRQKGEYYCSAENKKSHKNEFMALKNILSYSI
jgi:hypothetical protein